ncbi:ly6/PLAUR domain-containing protein 5-like isoform X2 [Pseudorasbora parva]|uniref:ly6/PLAUR domain-containing protein 5-like isoform X2 n=1 Tax=Pseudorasbora parva TaxID=51549 RepID=UPI00351F3CA7
MDLQLSVFLLFILLTAGHSLRCYQCLSHTGSCEDPEVTTCPDFSKCFSSVTVAQLYGSPPTTVKFKACVPSAGCLSSSLSSEDVSYFCCNTDLCNAKDAALSGESSPGIFNMSNILSYPSLSNNPNPPNPNGKRCYSCIGQSCLNIMDCSGSQDRCFKGTVAHNGQAIAISSCATKEVCDAATSVGNFGSFSCCEGNLCNGAQSVTQSFLFLCGSLLSYFLLH